MSYQNQNTQDPSPVEKVRQFLQGILSPAQLQQLDQILQGIDLNSGGSPAPVAMQLGGSEPGGKPAQDRRSVRARDAASGVGPTDSGPERPNYAPTSGPPLPPRPAVAALGT